MAKASWYQENKEDTSKPSIIYMNAYLMYSMGRKEIEHDQTFTSKVARAYHQEASDAAKPPRLGGGCESPGSLLPTETKPEMTDHNHEKGPGIALGPLPF